MAGLHEVKCGSPAPFITLCREWELGLLVQTSVMLVHSGAPSCFAPFADPPARLNTG